MIASIALFAIVIYMMGLATVQLATGRYRLDLETHVMCTGVGLATFGVTAVLLNTFGFRLTWWSVLLASCGLFILGALRDILAKSLPKHVRAREPFWTRESWCLLAASAFAFVMFLVFLNGAFAAPWLEDNEPWEHALSAKYVAAQQTYSVAPDVRRDSACYLEPYPPAYPALMGVLHQLSGSLVWTLKFFNVLLVSLGVVYFYLMVKQWTKRPVGALWMTGVLWILPCFLSHFIWAQSMSLVMFFPAFWALERSRGEPRWSIVAALLTAGICLSEPFSPILFLLMALVYVLVNLVFAVRGSADGHTVREVIYGTLAVAAGVLLSLVYYVPAYRAFGYEEFVRAVTGMSPQEIGLAVPGVGGLTEYSLLDLLWAPAGPRTLGQPTGVGIVLFLVLCAGVGLFVLEWHQTKRSRWRVTALAWLTLALVGVLAGYLPVPFFPLRFWAVLAIPVAMIAGEFLWFFASGLGARDTVLALVLGTALGAALALFGLGDALYRMSHAPLEGGRLVAAVLAGLTFFAALVLGLYILIQESAPPARCAVFAALALVTAGIVLTSGFAKTYFEGFAVWDCGARFYRRIVPGQDGRAVLVQNDLLGYVTVHRSLLLANTPVMGLTCSEERIVGFDMFTPPLDEDLRLLRKQVEELQVEQIDNETVRRIHLRVSARKFAFVTVDHYGASLAMLAGFDASRAVRDLMLHSGIDGARLKELIEGRMQPAPLEESFVKGLKEAVERQQAAAAQEEEQVRKVARLKEFLETSPLFKKEYDSGPFGMTLFRVNYPEETSKPES